MALTAALHLQIGQFQKSIQTAQGSMSGMGRHAKSVGSQVGPGLFGGVEAAAHKMASSVKGILSQLGIGALRQIGANLVTGLVNLGPKIRDSLQEGISQQQIEMSFGALMGNGSAMFEELRKQSLAVGMNIEDMVGSLRKFIAMEMSAGEAIKLNKSLLDIGGALGMSNYEIGLMGNALSQVKSKGVAMMEELRQQLGERGVPIFQALADRFNVKTPELFKMIQRGEVSAEDVIAPFRDMTGPFEKFSGGAERLANTVGGMINRIGQEFTDLKRIMQFEMLEPLTPVFSFALAKMQELKAGVRAAMDLITAAFEEIQGPGERLAFIGDVLTLGFKKAVNALYAGLSGVGAVIQGMNIGGIMNTVMESVGQGFASILFSATAQIMSMFAGLPIIGERFAIAAAKAGVFADIAAEQSKRTMAEAGEQAGTAFRDTMANAKQRFAEGSAGAVGPYDVSGDEAALADKFERIKQNAADKAAIRAGRQGIPEYEKGEGDAGKGGASGAAGLARSAPNSVWDALLGRSPQDALVKETQTQTGVLKDIKKVLEEKKPEARAPLADTRPRFGK